MATDFAFVELIFTELAFNFAVAGSFLYSSLGPTLYVHELNKNIH